MTTTSLSYLENLADRGANQRFRTATKGVSGLENQPIFFNGRFIIGNDYVRMYVTLVDSSWVVVANVSLDTCEVGNQNHAVQ